MSKAISLVELAKHTTVADCWIAVAGKVYDVTKFLSEHPGGKKILLRAGGKDATKQFNKFHNSAVMEKYGPDLLIGTLEGGEVVKKPAASTDIREFGELVPYGDPSWYQGQNSPYYTESHRQWRQQVRDFVETELMPHVGQWEQQNKTLPAELYLKAGKAGILAGTCGVPWQTKYAGAGPKDYDAFHELILYDELCRTGSAGVVWGLIEGLSIGLPPLLLFASDYLKDKVARDCLMGEKFICLCISEPWAGSDVAGMQTTAKKEGDNYIVNGAKKWITNGIWADYFTVAVRTGGPGGRGTLSMLLIEKTMPGVKCSKMDCTGAWGSGTTYVTFEDVVVPACNLIGKEGDAFKYIMYNFNHERWGFVVQAIRFARVCFEEAFKYAMQRKTFGKILMDHQVIRWKFAEMARGIESTQCWLESLTYQMNTMGKAESNPKLGGQIALLKAQATKTFEYCAREAVQIFGGAAYMRTGVGAKVERLYRDVKAMAIPGGSEEIMLDFAIRQAMKKAKL